MCEHVFEIDESRADAMGSMPCERLEEIVRLLAIEKAIQTWNRRA